MYNSMMGVPVPYSVEGFLTVWVNTFEIVLMMSFSDAMYTLTELSGFYFSFGFIWQYSMI